MAEDSSRARRAAKTAASAGANAAINVAVAKTTDRVASKVGVKGIEDVARRPTSVRAWTRAAARTGVSWLLNSAAPVVGGKAEDVLNAIGYKRILIAVVSLVVVSMCVVGAAVVGTIAAVENVMKPTAVVATVLDMIPGMGDDAEGDTFTQADIDELGRMCGAVPSPEQVVVEPANGESTNTPSTFVPRAVIDANGKATTEVKDAMKLIPPDADALRAETWMVYRFSHPDEDPHRGWAEFEQVYSPAYSLVASQKTPTDTAMEAGVRTDITPGELLMNIDPNGIYEPFYLAAASSIAYLGMEGWLDTITDEQLSVVMGRAVSLCGI